MLGEQALWEGNTVEAGLSLTPWGLIPGKPLWTNTISGDVAALQDAIDLLNDTVNNLQQNAVPYTNALWDVDLGSRSLNAGALRVVGVDVATRGANTFTGNQTVNGSLTTSGTVTAGGDVFLPILFSLGGASTPGTLRNGIRHLGSDAVDIVTFGNTRARFRWANTLQLPSTSGIDWMSSTDFPNATIVASLIPSSTGIHLGRQGLAYNLFVQADQASGRVGLPQNSVIGWANNADPGNALTSGFSQTAVNTVALGNGTAGDQTGTLRAQGFRAQNGNGVVGTLWVNNSNDTWSAFQMPASQNALTFSPGVAGGLFRFEGTTNAFPAFKRSGTTIQARLADDSGEARISASTIDIGGGTSALQFRTDVSMLGLNGGLFQSTGVAIGVSGFAPGISLGQNAAVRWTNDTPGATTVASLSRSGNTVILRGDSGLTVQNLAGTASGPVACNQVLIEGASSRVIGSAGSSFVHIGAVPVTFNINAGTVGPTKVLLQSTASSTQANTNVVLRPNAGVLEVMNAGETASAGVACANLTASGAVTVAVGTQALPSINFSSDTNTGFYRPSPQGVGIVGNGVASMLVFPSLVRVPSDSLIGWASGSAHSTNITTNLSQASAGVVQVGTNGANANGRVNTSTVGITGTPYVITQSGVMGSAFAINHSTTGEVFRIHNNITQVRDNLIINGSQNINEAGIIFQQAGVGQWQLYDAAGILRLYDHSLNAEVMTVNGATGAATFNNGLTTSGTLLATNANNSGRLEVRNGTSGNLVVLGDSGTGNVTINNSNTVGGDLIFQNRGVETFRIANNGVINLRTSTTANSMSIGGNGSNIVGNATWTGSGWIRTAVGPCSAVGIYGGTNPGDVLWFSAGSGISGSAVSFNETMRLVGATGNLLIGVTTDNGSRLQVNGNFTSSGLVSGVTGLEVRGAHHYRFDTNGNDGRIRNITSGAVPLTFDSSGNTTASGYVNWVPTSAADTSTSLGLRWFLAGGYDNRLRLDPTFGDLVFTNNSTERSRLTSNGMFLSNGLSAYNQFDLGRVANTAPTITNLLMYGTATAPAWTVRSFNGAGAMVDRFSVFGRQDATRFVFVGHPTNQGTTNLTEWSVNGTTVASVGPNGNIAAANIETRPPATVTPSVVNGSLTFEATSNTSLTIKYRGSDGVVRSTVLPLS
jgi:hypothetical protein